MDSNPYWKINSYNTIEFTKEFYDLGIKAKYAKIAMLPEAVVNNQTSHERIVQALLQHSPPASKKEYPCQRERKLSKLAREADEHQKETNE
jgi:hypothetical protein